MIILITLIIALGVSLFVSLASLSLNIFVISTLALLSVPLILFLNGKRVDIFEPIWFYAILYTLGYGYKAALITFNPQDFVTFPQYFPNDRPLILHAFFLSLLGLISLYIGYFSKFYLFLIKILPPLGDKSVNKKRLLWVSIFGVFIGSISMISFLRLVPFSLNWKDMLYNASIRSEILSQFMGRGFLLFPINHMPLFALGIYYSSSNRRIKISSLIVLLLVSTITIMSMGILGSKQGLLGFLIGLVTLYHYRIHRIRLLTALVILAIVGWSAGALAASLFSHVDSFVTTYDIVRILSGNFEFFDHLVTALSTVQNHYWGLTILEDLTLTYLPRAIFPWKPLYYGQVRLEETILPGLYGGESAFSATMAMGPLAEGYINFGLAGIILLPMLTGIFLRGLYEKARKDKGLFMVIYCYAFGILMSAIRGFGSFVTAILFMIAVVWFLYKLPLSIPWSSNRRIVS